MSHDHPPTPDPEDDPSPQNSAESTANPEPEAAGDAAAEDVVSGTNHPLSDSCPAANTPRPSPSGTSDKVIDNYFDNLQDTERDGEVYKVCRRQKLSDVPDVPDDGENTPPNLPDGCRTRVGRHVVSGVVRVGPMRAERRTFQNLECPELEMLLTGEAPLDTVIERAKGSSAEITFLDGDTHRWQSPPSYEELQAHIATVHPNGEAGWVSHGRGVKVAYIGPYHQERALAAAFSLPSSFSVEILPHTRHPHSISSDHPGSTCGPVQFFNTDPAAEFTFQAVGRLTPELRDQALAQLNMKTEEGGGRFDHDRCPIDPSADSDARNCVVVLDGGIYCHRCAGHGVTHHTGGQPGFLSFARIVGGGTTILDELAANLVHWTHAIYDLRHFYPDISEQVLELAYRCTLKQRFGESDPRTYAVFNRKIDFVWGDGLWLDAKTFAPTKVDNDAADSLPYCQYFVSDEDGASTRVDRLLRAQVKHRRPDGYRPIRPVRGISFVRNDRFTIPVIAPPEPAHGIEIVGDPMDEDGAFEILEQSFPRLERNYLRACLAAAICGEAGEGQTPMVACTGPSGSGKEQHIRLAASFVGDDIVKLPLKDDEETFFRHIGIALTQGCRFLVFDEFGKSKGLAGKLKPVLQISGSVSWRPLYVNRIAQTPMHAAIFYPCVRFPDFLSSSPEFCRRTRRVHLYRRLPNWAGTSGGDTAAWRDRTEDNAYVANSILTHIWRLCHEFNFQFS